MAVAHRHHHSGVDSVVPVHAAHTRGDDGDHGRYDGDHDGTAEQHGHDTCARSDGASDDHTWHHTQHDTAEYAPAGLGRSAIQLAPVVQ